MLPRENAEEKLSVVMSELDRHYPRIAKQHVMPSRDTTGNRGLCGSCKICDGVAYPPARFMSTMMCDDSHALRYPAAEEPE